MVIRVKIHEKSTPTSGRKQPSSSSSKKKKLSGRTPHNLERSHRDDHHGPSTMKDSSHPRTNRDKVSYDAMAVDSQARRESRRTRRDSSDAREDHGQSRRGRSKSVDRRDNSRNSGRHKQSRSPAYRHYNHRSKSPKRRLPPPRQPPQKKTEYVPLNLQLLEVASCSSKSTSAESKVSQVSRSGPPSQSEILASTKNKNHDDDTNAGGVASTNSDDDALASHSSSPGRDDAPSSLSSKGVTFINITNTGQAGANSSTPYPSMYGHANRPASPSLSKYASYAEQKGKKNKKSRSKSPSHKYQFHHKPSVKTTRSVGRSLSPATRSSRRRHDNDYYDASSGPSGSKSERATRTLSLVSSSSYIEEEHGKGHQKAKSERVPKKGVPSWGFSTWRSKFTGRNTKVRSTEEGDIRVKFESREFRDGEADADGDNSYEEYFDEDFESAGKQIQFLSSVVNKFGSYDSEDPDDEGGEEHKLCEIIRTTERLERKLEDVGDPTKPSMTPDEVGELVSALSEMHAQAAQLKRNSHAAPCLAEELVVVEEATEIHDDCSDWFDKLSKTMLGHCQWK